jgi:BirA family biotin operon repressor/biotin-[acetyl-CoA-carboxylase] ligase
VAVADVQTAGRGRHGRNWEAPRGAALLLSAGFRPRGLALQHAWRVAATVALAMLDAAEDQGLREGALRLKWPNDLVAEGPDGLPRKLAGVLGETLADAAGKATRVIVGIGVNVDWAASDFPPELAPAMTSLRELAGRPVDRDALLEGFLDRLEPRYEALTSGRFDVGGWSTRQLTTGRRLEVMAGAERLEGVGAGVDPDSGALLLEIAAADGTRTVRTIDSGEVTRCRLLGQVPGHA